MEKKQQFNVGIIISYALIIFNLLYGFFFFPFVVKQVGDFDFGIYQTLSSLIAQLSLVDFGVTAAVTRFVSKFNTKHQDENKNSYCSLAAKQSLIVTGIIVLVGLVFLFIINPLYGKSFGAENIPYAYLLFIIMFVNTIISIPFSFFTAIATAHERFVFANSLKLVQLLGKVGLSLCLVFVFKNSLALAISFLIVTVICLVVSYVYVKKKLNIKINLKLKTRKLPFFKESLSYILIMFLTSVIDLFNGNIDKVLIGANPALGPSAVTLYSYALMIFTVFNQVGCSLSDMMIPMMNDELENDATNKQAEEKIISIGRLQSIVTGLILFGFILLGKPFISLWIGEQYQDVYIYCIILLVSCYFSLCLTPCHAFLKAKGKLKARTIIIAIGALFNFVITFVGVYFNNMYFAAIGTGASSLIFETFIMCFIYKKEGLNIKRILSNIFVAPILSLGAATIILLPLALNISLTWLQLILAGFAFLIVSGLFVVLFVLRPKEIYSFLKLDRKIDLINLKNTKHSYFIYSNTQNLELMQTILNKKNIEFESPSRSNDSSLVKFVDIESFIKSNISKDKILYVSLKNCINLHSFLVSLFLSYSFKKELLIASLRFKSKKDLILIPLIACACGSFLFLYDFTPALIANNIVMVSSQDSQIVYNVTLKDRSFPKSNLLYPDGYIQSFGSDYFYLKDTKTLITIDNEEGDFLAINYNDSSFEPATLMYSSYLNDDEHLKVSEDYNRFGTRILSIDKNSFDKLDYNLLFSKDMATRFFGEKSSPDDYIGLNINLKVLFSSYETHSFREITCAGIFDYNEKFKSQFGTPSLMSNFLFLKLLPSGQKYKMALGNDFNANNSILTKALKYNSSGWDFKFEVSKNNVYDKNLTQKVFPKVAPAYFINHCAFPAIASQILIIVASLVSLILYFRFFKVNSLRKDSIILKSMIFSLFILTIIGSIICLVFSGLIALSSFLLSMLFFLLLCLPLNVLIHFLTDKWRGKHV